MPVVLLAGGRGTRLGEFTNVTPKPLVKVGPSPIIQHLMNWFIKYGYDEFYILTGYLHEEIEKYFLHVKYSGNKSIFISDNEIKSDTLSHLHCKITLVNTGIDSGIAFRVKQVQKFIGNRPFILTYSDGLANVDIDKLVEYHSDMKKSRDILVTLSAIQPSSRFGVVDIDKNGLVERFREKPSMNDWINIGFMVLEPGIFKYLENIKESDMLESDIFPGLATEQKITAYLHRGAFKSMDSYKDYTEFNKLWDSGKIFWKV